MVPTPMPGMPNFDKGRDFNSDELEQALFYFQPQSTPVKLISHILIKAADENKHRSVTN